MAAYFSGIASVFDTANVGIYGGRRAIEWAMSSGAARWFWQTGAWSADHRVPGIHLWQRIPTTRLGAYEIDIDDSLQADYGAWFTTGEAMAWCPFAKKMELLPESNSQAAIKPTQFILHSIAAPWTVQRIFEYWRDSTNLDSHFGLGFDGSLGQYIGTQTRADASAQANVRAISLESASNLQHTDPWTDAQVAMIIRLGVWLCQTHGIPARKPSSWDAPGIGYHRMYPQWSTGGTACPGDARVRQFDQLILPGIQRGLAGGPIPTTPSSGDEFDMASVEEVTNSVTAAVVKRLRDDPYPEATFELDGKPYVPRGFEVDREIYIFKKQVMDVLAEIRAAQSTPVPVQVDATAVAAAIAADKTLMSAIAKAVADEDHKRTEA
ncbi:N-acetylmuramoyl-L-alanine amidase [Embleya sp. NPDC001921]